MKNLYVVFGLGALLLLVGFTSIAETKDQLFSVLDAKCDGHEKARKILAKNFDDKELEIYDALHSDLKYETEQAKIALNEWLDARSKIGNPAADSLANVLLDQIIKLNTDE